MKGKRRQLEVKFDKKLDNYSKTDVSLESITIEENKKFLIIFFKFVNETS